MDYAKLVPELTCSDIERSLRFYVEVLGFEVLYERPDERFAYLERDGAQLMIEQPTGRSWVPAELSQPYGRGINLQIEVADVDRLYRDVQRAAAPIYLPMEDAWYRREDRLLGARQFIVMDPDGYLLRFAEHLGERAV